MNTCLGRQNSGEAVRLLSLIVQKPCHQHLSLQDLPEEQPGTTTGWQPWGVVFKKSKDKNSTWRLPGAYLMKLPLSDSLPSTATCWSTSWGHQGAFLAEDHSKGISSCWFQQWRSRNSPITLRAPRRTSRLTLKFKVNRFQPNLANRWGGPT